MAPAIYIATRLPHTVQPGTRLRANSSTCVSRLARSIMRRISSGFSLWRPREDGWRTATGPGVGWSIRVRGGGDWETLKDPDTPSLPPPGLGDLGFLNLSVRTDKSFDTRFTSGSWLLGRPATEVAAVSGVPQRITGEETHGPLHAALAVQRRDGQGDG
jgi:hypothetical protein